MKCPSCNETLLMSDKNGIEIDYCPNCRGIWLDRGELDKIIERSATHYSSKDNYGKDQERYSQRDQEYQQRSQEYQKPYHKKKGSFLGDIFDF
ncbi:zf-TFIIB domain-containing protein [Pedobacter frigoris]|uniref:TFIIB-type zinc ribbon-containing protein n=1 Tax=Pedobacter frigoris TaxID=2571272 RepID=UPI002930986F|nr:zf-TFIIB domain-containing protein [Pedobacter frigoris]